MINTVEIEEDQLKVNLISEDIRMLILGYKTNELSNIEVKRVISLLGRTTPVEKLWRERLVGLIIHREEMKLKKKKRIKQKKSEEREKYLREMMIQIEKSRD